MSANPPPAVPDAGAGWPAFATPLTGAGQVEAVRTGDKILIRGSNVTGATEPYLAGHFPGFRIFPGVFLIEALRQAVWAALGERGGQFPDIVALRSVRFLAPLLPGDEMSLAASADMRPAGQPFTVSARCCRLDGSPVAKLTVVFRYGGCDGA